MRCDEAVPLWQSSRSRPPAPLTPTALPQTHQPLPSQQAHRRAAVQAVALADGDETGDVVPQAAVLQVVPEHAGRAGVGQDVGIPLLHRVVGEAPVALAGALQQGRMRGAGGERVMR